MMRNDKVENIIDKHQKYWQASEEYIKALDELNGTNGLDIGGIQRLRMVKTKLMSDRCQIEFELNKILARI